MDVNNHEANSKSESHFLNLFKIALSDSEIDPREIQLLYEMGLENKYTREEIDYLIENPHKIVFIKPSSNEKVFDELYDLCRMILADEKIDLREVESLKSYLVRIGTDESKIHEVMNTFIEGVRNKEDKEQLRKQFIDLFRGIENG